MAAHPLNLSLTAVMALLLLVVAAPVAAGPAEAPRTVSVTGEGSITVAPDSARVTVAVEAREASLDTARSAVLAASGATLAALERLGIEAGAIDATALLMQPEYRWDENTRSRQQNGYLVQRTLTVDLDDIGLLGQVLEEVADSGINRVAPPELRHSRALELRREAAAAAAVDARARAQAIAAALGAEVGAARSIASMDAMGPGPRPVAAELRAMADSAARSAPETYGAGTIEFSARVQATFDLHPQP